MRRDYRLYIDDILQSIDRVERYTKGMDHDIFASDEKTVDAVVRNLEVIGEAARNIPDSAREKAPEVDWRKIVALRNILAHEYFGINTHIVWDIVQTKLGPLRDVCLSILASESEE
jgi:uncharacterized protein with HEPN domain